MEKTPHTLRRRLTPPAAQLTLHTLLALWMLHLEEESGTPREDWLYYFRKRLLPPRTRLFAGEACRMPLHPDELHHEDLFTFMWQVRRLAKRRLHIALDFNAEAIFNLKTEL